MSSERLKGKWKLKLNKETIISMILDKDFGSIHRLEINWKVSMMLLEWRSRGLRKNILWIEVKVGRWGKVRGLITRYKWKIWKKLMNWLRDMVMRWMVLNRLNKSQVRGCHSFIIKGTQFTEWSRILRKQRLSSAWPIRWWGLLEIGT